MFGIKRAFAERPLTLVDESTITDYRIVVANLVSILEKNQAKVFVCSGIANKDKKSEVALNIALTLTKSEKKVLFINYDDEFEFPEGIKELSTLTVKENDDVVAIAKKEQEKYDYVIINVRNVNDKIENINIAKEVDGIVFILNKLISKKTDFANVLSNFSHVNVRILGAVFIDAE